MGNLVSYQETQLAKNLGSEENAIKFLEHDFVQQYWREYQDLTNKLTRNVRKENPDWILELKEKLGKEDSRVQSSRILVRRRFWRICFSRVKQEF